MKTTLRMSRLFGALAALLLLSVSSFTLTSCGDDDDDDFNLMFDGEKAKVTKVEVWGSTGYIYNGEDVKCYSIYIYGIDEDGEKGMIEIDLGGPLFGKTLDLTKDVNFYDVPGEGPAWWTYMGIYEYEEEYDGYEDIAWYDVAYDDEEEGYESDFKSGTLYVSLSGSSITIKAQGVTSDNESFSINYSGKYSEPIYSVKGEVKSKNQAKKNK